MFERAMSVALLVLGCANAWSEGRPSCGKNHYILDEPCDLVATATAIGWPTGIAVHPSGKVYFSSQNVVYAVGADGILEHIAGTGEPGFGGDGGPATQALLNFPLVYPELEYDPVDYAYFYAGLAFDASGNLYIADSYNNRVRKVDAGDGTIGTYFWHERVWPDFSWPQGLAFDSVGRLYVSEQAWSVFRIAEQGAPMERIARIMIPEAIAIDRNDNVYVAEAVCAVWKVGPGGELTAVAGSDPCWAGHTSELSYPYGVAVDRDGRVFIADTSNNCIRRKDPSGGLVTIAGVCGRDSQGFAGDGGPADHARLNTPFGIAFDTAGNLYVSDTGNKRLRRIDADGTITTIAGNGLPP